MPDSVPSKAGRRAAWKYVLLGAGGVIVLLLIAAFFAFRHMGEIARRMVESVAPEVTGVPVKVRSMSLNPLSGRGQVAGVKMDNPAGFPEEPALEVELADVALDPQSLKQAPVVVRQASLSGVKASLERSATGATNVGTIVQSVEKYLSAHPVKGGGGSPLAALRINDGRLDDLALALPGSGQSLKAAQVEFTLDGQKLTKRVRGLSLGQPRDYPAGELLTVKEIAVEISAPDLAAGQTHLLSLTIDEPLLNLLPGPGGNGLAVLAKEAGGFVQALRQELGGGGGDLILDQGRLNGLAVALPGAVGEKTSPGLRLTLAEYQLQPNEWVGTAAGLTVANPAGYGAANLAELGNMSFKLDAAALARGELRLSAAKISNVNLAVETGGGSSNLALIRARAEAAVMAVRAALAEVGLLGGGGAVYAEVGVEKIKAALAEAGRPGSGPQLAAAEATLSVSPRQIVVELNDVSLGNPAGYSDSPAAKLDRLTLKLDGTTIFSQRVVIEELSLGTAQISYEINSRGANFTAIRQAAEEVSAALSDEKSKAQVVIRNFNLQGGEVAISGGPAGMLLGRPKLPLNQVKLENIEGLGWVGALASLGEQLSPSLKETGRNLAEGLKGSKEGVKDIGKAVGEALKGGAFRDLFKK